MVARAQIIAVIGDKDKGWWSGSRPRAMAQHAQLEQPEPSPALDNAGVGGRQRHSAGSGAGSESEGEAAPARRARGCGAAAGGAELARQAAGEAAATLLLLLLTCLPAAPAAPLTLRALTAGFVVALLVQCFDHISGAMMNPTVTLAAAVAGRLAARAAAVLAAAQVNMYNDSTPTRLRSHSNVVGAFLSAAALTLLAPAGSPAACVTKPAPGMPVFQALCIEAVLGGCLALANCAAWDARNRRLLDSWPLRIGFTVTALSLVGGDLTGASMNPLRSLGPALCSGDWTHHWIYWLGPLTGSALVSAGYRALWAAAPRAPARGASPPASRRASPAPPKLFTPA